jgi:hypothetical protein
MKKSSVFHPFFVSAKPRLGANGLGSKGAQLAAELVLKMKLQRFWDVFLEMFMDFSGY